MWSVVSHTNIHMFADGMRREWLKLQRVQGLGFTANCCEVVLCTAGSCVASDEAAWSTLCWSFLEVLTIWLYLLHCTVCDQLMQCNLGLCPFVSLRPTEQGELRATTGVKFGSEWQKQRTAMSHEAHVARSRFICEGNTDVISYA